MVVQTAVCAHYFIIKIEKNPALVGEQDLFCDFPADEMVPLFLSFQLRKILLTIYLLVDVFLNLIFIVGKSWYTTSIDECRRFCYLDDKDECRRDQGSVLNFSPYKMGFLVLDFRNYRSLVEIKTSFYISMEEF